MYSLSKIIRTISLLGAYAFAVTAARAVDPPPGGGYPNQNTAVGDGNALFSLTTSVGNTAVGFDALFSNIGYNNTASGTSALYANTIGGSNTANGFSALS